MKRITFSISGVMGKQRPKAHIVKGHPVIYTPKETKAFENHVATEYMSQGGFKFDADLPLRIVIRVFQAIPKATSKAKRLKMLANDIRPTKKPDIDNIGKIVMDALNGVAYEDDRQVVEMNVTKFYGTEDQMEVTIREVTQ